MKKIFLILGSVIALLILLIMFLFSSTGNNIIKPYVEKMIKEKSGYDVKFETFRIGFSDLNLKGDINKEIFLNLNGPYSIFSRSFDVEYKVDIKNLKSFGLELNENMNLYGKVSGNINNFNANASGKFLDSDVKIMANIIDMKPYTLKIDANGLNLAKALPLAKQPLYAFGSVDINADIQNAQGKATINAKDIRLNEKVFKNDLNISLPQNTMLSGISELKMQGETINAKTYLNSNLNLEASAKNTTINLKTKHIDSDFDIKLNDLSKLEPFTKQKLIGNLDILGAISIEDKKLSLFDAKVLGLDGDIKANVKDENLQIKLKDVSLSKVLKMLNQPNLSSGKINADISSNISFNDVSGAANIKEALLNKTQLDSITGKNFPNNLTYNFDMNFDKKDDAIKAKANLDSKIAKFDIKNTTIKNGEVSSDYTLNISDLNELSFLTNTKLKGNFVANGSTTIQNGKFLTSLTSNFLNGNLKIDIKNDNFNKTGFDALILTSNFKNFDMKKLTDMLGYKHIYDGIGNASFNYDLNKAYGSFSLDINDGAIASNEFINILKALSQGSFEAAVFDKTDVNGTIKSNIVNFDAWIGNSGKSGKKSKGSFNIDDGNINLITSKIYIPVRGNIEKTDISIDITGTTKEPKYNVSSQYLKSKFSRKLNKGLDKLFGTNSVDTNNTTNLDQNASSKDVAKDAIKGILKGLF
ncbi:Uncharacterized protein involved in outer membrane biogenesis [Campylobacter sputorum subsp. bubulus]|uniref:Uncharacterized protein involved in outer membrane biogenesis n=1 Tax=Campylobacter sputorum subsp. sputorum TaxID=32024 RepID=A0A381DH54_9BACT|nr:hypothetical protein [Campylobacter sputorum]ASM35074.1 hypothetical protein CSPUT_0850 [Campylobacter sputorum aubsp. sputorum RM3237]KAB0581324.1 hypothetical protein F7P64_06790 [Campylobacter sputorum subsp. sputorum]QEL05264.1 hypothetical protein CSPT_0848 [Campylobacter sputorum subsp. sputorum]SUX08936.1 Uncharacterized protein involved in outer membrane biogenesis [Campylobacter sputorum subsp. bubulus]SUX09767.1 Uncharacterized protein involved in outer membrane biogenesis [Campyl